MFFFADFNSPAMQAAPCPDPPAAPLRRRLNHRPDSSFKAAAPLKDDAAKPAPDRTCTWSFKATAPLKDDAAKPALWNLNFSISTFSISQFQVGVHKAIRWGLKYNNFIIVN